jgi:arylsulfatase A-like enzyme/cytochrome c-type biogenesis protein CcmH/NrfG
VRRGLPVVLAAAVLAAACGGPATGPFREAPVVFVSIDTLRADRLGGYGYAKGRTPNLDALAREGIVFDSAWSHCPMTLPAHASMLTGLLPPRHGVRDNVGFALDASHRTLATRFKAAGLATGGAVSAYVLRRATGIAQGFDTYEDALDVDLSVGLLGAQQRDGAVATEALVRWIEGQGQKRFFALLHLYEPHSPYAPPPQHRDLPEAYDGDVAYADELVGRLVARLKKAGLYDRAILAVTSDHGEGLMDHGEQEHGFFLYREAVHVPLILRLPGGRRGGTRVSGPVAQVDLPATLLDLAGVPADGMDGVSQRPALESGKAQPRSVYAETFFPRYHFGWSELLSVTEDRYRYIRAPRPELYDMREDPRETRNLAGERASAVVAMNAWLEREAKPGEVARPAEVSDETREALRALGYVGSTVVDVSAGSLPDPKDKLGVYEMCRRAMQARSQGRLEEAVAGLRRVLADSPGVLDAWEVLGGALVQLGREREAVAAYDQVIERDPTNASAHLSLAKVHGLAGRRDRAERHAELASAKEPGRGFETLAQILLDQDRPAEAAAYARKSLAADPDRLMSRFVLGLVAQRAGRCEEAVAEYRKAAEIQSRRPGLVVRNLHAGLGDCLARLGREAEAEAEFRAEIAAIPWSREARMGLGVLCRSQGRDAEARAVLAGIVTENPRAGVDEYFAVARTLAVLGDVPAAREWAARGRTLYPSDRRFR